MCWSGEASATLAAVGLTSTAYIAYKGEAKALWIPLGYFALMELLQAITYTVIDQCGLPLNQILTLLGFLHITFQPFFINTVSMYFIPDKVREKISPFVYGICFLGSILLLVQLYPFQWAGNCHIGHEPFCGEHLCSVSGNWHIAWEAPLNGMSLFLLWYCIPAFLVPIIYGAWKPTLYHLLVGPLLARTLTDNINEWPAVWCLMSIGLLLIVIKTPIRQLLHNKEWLFWDYRESELSDGSVNLTDELLK